MIKFKNANPIVVAILLCVIGLNIVACDAKIKRELTSLQKAYEKEVQKNDSLRTAYEEKLQKMEKQQEALQTAFEPVLRTVLKSEDNEVSSLQKEERKNDKFLFFDCFYINMPKSEYEQAKQKQIASGKWQLYTKTTYYQYLFTDDNSVYQLLNDYDAEFKFAPTFKNNLLASWRIPIWPMFHQDQYRELNMETVVNHFAKEWGAPERAGKAYKWHKKNTLIIVEEQVIENGPYGYSPIPVVIFAKAN